MTLAGVDEVHYGCIFGPVYAAAVVIPEELRVALSREGVRDSKAVSKESERRHLAWLIKQTCIYGISYCTAEEMRLWGWGRATHEAMCRSLVALNVKPELVQVDGNKLIQGYPREKQQAVVGGDRTILEISAASIIAKVAADNAVVAMAKKYPWYDLEHNKGYLSPAHQRGIDEHGLCPEHRRYRSKNTSYGNRKCIKQAS